VSNNNKQSDNLQYLFCVSDLILQGDSRGIMSLTKFVMQPTLLLHRLCGFKNIIFNFNSQHA
jgi:hypothetical protein